MWKGKNRIVTGDEHTIEKKPSTFKEDFAFWKEKKFGNPLKNSQHFLSYKHILQYFPYSVIPKWKKQYFGFYYFLTFTPKLQIIIIMN